MSLVDRIAHRPWPLSRKPWVMAQRWHDLLFAHGPISTRVLRAAVPSALELDTFEGRAWLGVVPFRMSGVRLRGTPAIPGLSAFPELNVRTYVTLGGKPGVYFFSLEARNPIAVAVARAWFHLPYFRARMRCDREGEGIRYESVRTHAGAPPARLAGTYCPVDETLEARPGTLEHWLTERYCLYAALADGRVWRAEIHHPPWPLQRAEASFEHNTMPAAHGLDLEEGLPLLHFVRRQDVVVWNPERVL
jgi:uncharacterized protein YqjF (DUF2071 family)